VFVSVLLVSVVVMAGAVTSPTASQEAAIEVAEVRGSAFGLFIDVEITLPPPPGAAEAEGNGLDAFEAVGVEPEGAEPAGGVALGPIPEVVLPADGGGPFTDSLVNEAIDFPAPITDGFVEAANVSTEGALGADGFARSSAEMLGADISGIVASSITSECEATLDGASGSAELLDLEFSEVPLGDVTPAPNTVLDNSDIPTIGTDITITLNAQETVVVDGVETLVVTALRVEAAVGGNSPTDGLLEVGQSACGVLAVAEATPAAPTPITPAFTG
jgi:hypothetical protein